MIRKARPAVLAAPLLLACAVCAGAGPVAGEVALWEALRDGGHAALLRHALAPGSGDPEGFDLADCATQRNLSAAGREQAARIGARMRANGITQARVFSSQLCRCLETARLLEFGPVRELALLNSFYRREGRDTRTAGLRTWLAEQRLGEPTVLVTHQVNISALTGVYPDQGTLVVVRPTPEGAVEVLGSIPAD